MTEKYTQTNFLRGIRNRVIGKDWMKADRFTLVCHSAKTLDKKNLGMKHYGGGRGRDVSVNFTPRYIAVRGKEHGRVIMTHMHMADYFFSGVGPGMPSGDCSVAIGGTAVSGFSLYIGNGLSAYYVGFDNHISGMTRSATVEFTLALAELHEFDYWRPNSIESLSVGLARTERSHLVMNPTVRVSAESLLTQISSRELPLSKITSAHHTHYRAIEVATAIGATRLGVLHIVRDIMKCSDAHDSAVAGYLLWLHTLDDELLAIVYDYKCWEHASLVLMTDSLKKCVRRAKLFQNNCTINLLPIFEADVLINRGVGAVDWKTERDNRLKPDVVKIPDEDVYQASLRILSRGKSDHGRVKNMTWDQYWKQRWQFTPTGSVKSQHTEDLVDLPSDYRLKNKFVALNTTDLTAFDDWIKREPAIEAWASVKYEWGKERAIYGCDLTNFVLTNFCMFECEEKLPPNFPVGKRAEPGYVSKLLDGVLHGHEPFCFDFEDFNSQHSTGSMRQVLRAYADVYGDQMSQEQRVAMTWVISSLNEMVVHDNVGTKSTYHANGTLFSGWRLTTFINSVLNAVYTELIYEPTASKHPLTSAHNGDDVIIGVNNALQAQGMLLKGLHYNVRAQPAKCVLSGVAEFLRVDRSVVGNGQYLPRAIATLIHSRVESGPATALPDALRSNETRLSEFVDRGGDVTLALAMRDRYYSRVPTLYGNTSSEANLILEVSSVLGGLSMSRSARVDFTVTRADSFDEVDTDDSVMHLGGKRAWRGVADMTNEVMRVIGSKTGANVKREDVAKRIYDSTLSALSLTRRRYQVSPNRYLERARNWREHRGSFSNLRKNGTLGVARLAGIKIDLLAGYSDDLDQLIHKMGQSAEPMTFLSLAT